MPCGGSIFLYCTLPSCELAPRDPAACGGGPHAAAAVPTGWEGAPGDDVDSLPAAAAVSGRLLGPGAALLDCSVRGAPADLAAQLAVAWPEQLGQALARPVPAPGKQDFFRLRPLSPAAAAASPGEPAARRGAAAVQTAVLQAHKLPQHLVVCVRHRQALGAGGEGEVAATAAGMAALCAAAEANLVAVDVRCPIGGEGGVTSAWLLFVAGFELADGRELHGAVLRHLGAAAAPV